MIMTLYVLVYSVLKVMICLGGQLFQLDFLQSIHYSPFNKSFYEFLGMVSVFLKGWTYVVNSECLSIRDTFLNENGCATLAYK